MHSSGCKRKKTAPHLLEDPAFRKEVAGHIRNKAKVIESDQPKTGWIYSMLRAHRLYKLADRFELCGSFKYVVKCKSCKQFYISNNRCEVRICPECSRKYAYLLRQKQSQLLEGFEPHRGLRLRFLTLTKKTPPEKPTSYDVRMLNKNVRKLINELWPKRMGCGALSVIEVGKKYNFHVHVIVYGHYVNYKLLSEKWLSVTGDSRYVWISQVRSPSKCLNYLIKYLYKPPAVSDPEYLADYLIAISGIRRIHTFGVFYNISKIWKKGGCPCPLCGGKLERVKMIASVAEMFGAISLNEAMKAANPELN